MSHLQPSELSILLVEPSDTQRKIISQRLMQEGVSNIQTATTLAEALHIINRHQPDLVASAMHFEDGTALELLQQLKASVHFNEIQFMLVSSECRREQLEHYRQSGVVAILPKPFSSEHLGKALNATIDLLTHDELDLTHFDVQDLRVLVVDDSKMARNIIKRTITNLGLRMITEAQDGQEAIELMQQQMFDLVITDYNMP
ncbi:response regulator, partial [Shewanella sp. 0m-11]